MSDRGRDGRAYFPQGVKDPSNARARRGRAYLLLITLLLEAAWIRRSLSSSLSLFFFSRFLSFYLEELVRTTHCGNILYRS